MTASPFNGRIFSLDSAKAIKAQGYGYLNAIMYMAPHSMGGVGNLCPHASPQCIAACLGWFSGQASMVKHDSDLNSVRLSRMAKAKAFMHDRVAFMRRVAVAIGEANTKAARLHLALCVRLNGSADIAFEGVAVDIDAATAKALSKHGFTVAIGRYRNMMEVFPAIQFVDYTKNPFRMKRTLPANYHLTFSRAENNEAESVAVLQNGGNVAVVFGEGLPATWNGFPVIDGDKHDLRHLDPTGCVVGLSPKGRKAQRDLSGFVVRGYASSLPMVA